MKLTRKALNLLIEMTIREEESKTSDREEAAAVGAAEFLKDFNKSQEKQAAEDEVLNFVQGAFDVEEKSQAQKISDELIQAISGGEAQPSKGSVKRLVDKMKVIGISDDTLDKLANLKLSNPGNVEAGTKLSDAGASIGGGGDVEPLGDLFNMKGDAQAAKKSELEAIKVKGQKGYTYAEIDGNWHFVKSSDYKGSDSNWKKLNKKGSVNLVGMIKKYGKEAAVLSESLNRKELRRLIKSLLT